MELRLWRWSESGWTTESVWNYCGCLLLVALSAWPNPTGRACEGRDSERNLGVEEGGRRGYGKPESVAVSPGTGTQDGDGNGERRVMLRVYAPRMRRSSSHVDRWRDGWKDGHG